MENEEKNNIEDFAESIIKENVGKVKSYKGVRKRVDKLIEVLPKNDYNYKKSAIEAGYSPSTATQTPTLKKTVLNRLNQLQEQGLLEKDPYFNVYELLKEYGKIIAQDKDLGTKYKAIQPILGKYGIVPTEQNTGAQLPPLIIGIKEVKITKDE